MEEKKVSVIIPAYNAEKYLHRAVNSVLSQEGYPEDKIEIIIVNDGSTDKTGEIAKAYGPPVKVIEKENGGVASAFNAGVKEATGDYIMWLSADDIWYKDKIAEQMKVADEHTILYSDYIFIDETDAYIGDYISRGYENPKDFVVAAFSAAEKNTMFTNFSTVCFPKKVFEEYKFDESLKFGEDLDFLLRNMKCFKWKRVPKILLRYRVHQANLTSKKLLEIPKNNEGIRQRAKEWWKNHECDNSKLVWGK